MRLVSWNLHGATVPGRATVEQQHRAWSHLRDLGADLVLAQEVGSKGIPGWAADEWTFLTGIPGVGRKTWTWGSVIAAWPGLNLRPRLGVMNDPWLAHLYDLVLVGEVDMPRSGPTTVASVHTVAQELSSYLAGTKGPTLSPADAQAIQRPGYRGRPYVNDFAFEALSRAIADRRFIVSGDWNTCRGFDKHRSKPGTAFFERASARGWRECHRGPIEPSYLGRRGTPTYQLDHAFADPATAATRRQTPASRPRRRRAVGAR